jgi:predicted amidophosphoribosyltransferase
VAAPISWLDALLELVLPVVCVGCGASGSVFCARCIHACARPLTMRVPWPVVAYGWYAGALRTGLIRYKERGQRDLAEPLAQLLETALVRAFERAPPAGIVLVPVPSARSIARQRGGNHVLRLARRAGRGLDLPVHPLLSLQWAVRDSAGLGAEQRRTNLAGAMAARRCPGGGRPSAVIVDDIVTTGTTLREAARALTDAGWHVSGAAVVAATPRGNPKCPQQVASHLTARGTSVNELTDQVSHAESARSLPARAGCE